MSDYRINGFAQIKAFYSIVFEQKHPFKPQHISLYVFLINQNNRNNWVEWFKLPYDLAMAGACIGSKKTYYNCLSDLQAWGLIQYEKGANEWKSPKIKVEVLKCTSTVPQSEPLPIPQPKPLGEQLHTPQGEPLPIQSNITYNHKPETINQEQENGNSNSSSSIYDVLNTQTRWKEEVCMSIGLKPHEIEGLLNDFPTHVSVQGNDPPHNLKEAKNYFSNYARKRKSAGDLPADPSKIWSKGIIEI